MEHKKKYSQVRNILANLVNLHITYHKHENVLKYAHWLLDNNYIIICIIKKSITQYLITDILVETMQYKVKIYIMPDKSNT